MNNRYGPETSGGSHGGIREPNAREWTIAFVAALVLVGITRAIVARDHPIEYDEIGFVDILRTERFPMHHTLYLALGRVIGLICGDGYRALIILGIVTSVGGVLAIWWMLRAVVEPRIAAGCAWVFACSPLYWSLGGMAANTTAIPLAEGILWGLALRVAQSPRAWHAFAAAVVFGVGMGYRLDLGLFGFVIAAFVVARVGLRVGGLVAVEASALAIVIILAWLAAMFADCGGWSRFQAAGGDFALHLGQRAANWKLGFWDGPCRAAVKIALALVWTLGPLLLLVPRGWFRLRSLTRDPGPLPILHPHLRILAVVSCLPILGFHLGFHFGTAGYALHYLPVLMILIAVGLSPLARARALARSPLTDSVNDVSAGQTPTSTFRKDPPLTVAFATLGLLFACWFWFYPARFDDLTWRGGLDLAIGRYSRAGLHSPMTRESSHFWRPRMRDAQGLSAPLDHDSRIPDSHSGSVPPIIRDGLRVQLTRSPR